MASLFDLHVHSTGGSPDSDLSPEEFIEEARRLGLNGGLFSEHNGFPRHEFERIAQQADDLVLINGIEFYTNYGHVLTIGIEGYSGGVIDINVLREQVDKANGFMILAHPFRFLFDPSGLYTRNILFEDPDNIPQTAEEASTHPVFEIIDEVEVVNGGNLQEENRFAQGVVKVVGKKGTGGSDAHSTNGLAKGMTVFHGDIRNQEDLVEALRAGAFTPVENYHIGKTSLYGDLVEDVMPFLQSLDSYDAGPDQKETYGIAE